jgi:uncharacterized FlaG/YvyC family protein
LETERDSRFEVEDSVGEVLVEVTEDEEESVVVGG